MGWLTVMGRRPLQLHFALTAADLFGPLQVNGQSYQACDLSPQALVTLTNAELVGFTSKSEAGVILGGEAGLPTNHRKRRT